MPIRSSVGQNGVNSREDVRLIQDLLNRQTSRAYTFGKIVVDGLIGQQTIGAIKNFQLNVVRLSMPDGRVDPGGRTFTALEQGVRAVPPPPPPPPRVVRPVTVVFRHGGKVPSASGNDMYESTIEIQGAGSGTYRGSIYPDNMNVKGRIKDGSYSLHIGFHKRNSKVPTAADLIVKNNANELRPALIVNRDGTVPVLSNNASKTTSSLIHVHNGFNSSRGSDGCLTLKPSDWPAFIKTFLDMYTELKDWYPGPGQYIGLSAGTLEVKA